MASLWALNVLSSQIFRFPPFPHSIVSFLHQPTSNSNFSPVLSFTNVAASSDTASCAAPMSRSIWVLPPRARPTPLTAALLSLSILVGGLVFLPGPPRTPPTPSYRYLCLSDGGGVVLIPVPPRVPPTFLSMSVLVVIGLIL